MATPIWISGFEAGVLSASGGGIVNAITGTVDTNVAINTTSKRSGSYGLQVYPSSSTAVHVTRNIAAGVRCCVGRLYFKLPATLPTADHVIMRQMTSVQQLIFAYNYNSGTYRLSMTVNAGTPQYFTGFAADTWYRLDWRFDTSTGTSTIDWQIDGVAQTQATRSVAAADIIGCNLGITTAAVGNIYYDDVILSATSGDYPIGAGSVVALTPDSDGTHTDASDYLQDNDSNHVKDISDVHDHLNSVPISESTLYIKQTGTDTNAYAEVGFADTTKSTINGVIALLAYQSSAASPSNNGQARIYTEDDDYDTIFSGDMSESSMFYKSVIIHAPDGTWDQAAVNALKARIGYSSDAAPVPYWENLMLEVDGPDITNYELAVNNAAHALACDGSLTLAQQHTLAMNNSAFALAASSSIALIEHKTLALSDAAFTLAATSPTLSTGGEATLTISDAAFALSATTPTLVQQHTLAVNSSAFALASTTPTLVQQHTIAVNNSAFASASDNVTLTQQHTLAVNSAAFAHAADNITLDTPGTLSVQNAAFAHAADNIVLFQAHTLAVNNSAFALAADNVTLGAGNTLSVNAAAFASSASNIDLTQVHILAMSNAAFAETASSITLGVGLTLSVQNAAFVLTASSVSLNELRTLAVNNSAFTLAATSPTLSRTFVLAVDNAAFASTAGSLALFQAHTIVVSSAAIALDARNIVLATPELAVLYPDDAAFALKAQRIMMLEATEELLHSIDVEPREYVHNSQPRTFVHLSNGRAYVADVEPRMRP